MKLIKKIDKEKLFQALKLGDEAYSQANKFFGMVPGAWNKVFANKDDPRDLLDLAFFLKYRRMIDGTGEPLSNEEFEKECKDLITAFANNDREKIYGYLDLWFDFALNYNPPENITTEDEALKNFIYLRAKQGLGDTKMKNYPDYVKARFSTLDSIIQLQKLQIEINIQSEVCDLIYHGNGFNISTEAYRVITGNDEKSKNDLKFVCLAYMGMQDEIEKRAEMVSSLFDAFNLSAPNPQGLATVKKVDLPKWIDEINLDESQNNRLKSELKEFGLAIRESLGVDQTSSGLLRRYLDLDQDIGIYKFIFIDGVSIYDTMPDPKKIEDGAKTLLNAFRNKTGVVSFVHAAEINGKFEYSVDTLDCNGGVENKEYSQKIDNLLNSEEARKALYQSIEQNLTPFLTEASKTYTKKRTQTLVDNAKLTLKAKDDAIKKGRVYKDKAPDGSSAVSISIDKRYIAPAMLSMGEGREIYRRYSREFFKKHPELDKALKAKIPGTNDSVCDQRDFLDLFLLAKMAKTYGLGEKNVSGDEDRQIVEEMLTAFAMRDHAGISKYLNYMFDFLSSYEIPKNIETSDDMMRAMMYIRLQQTSSMKQKENPWYIPEKYPDLMDKGRFEAFETEYFVKYQKLDAAFMQQTKINVASPYGMAKIYADARMLEAEQEEAAAGEPSDDYLEDRRLEQRHENYAELRETLAFDRKKLLDASDEFEKKYTFKISLPDSALIAGGENVDAGVLSEAGSDLYYDFFCSIYTTDYADSKVLRSHYFTNNSSRDAMRLVFVDGKSVYDIISERDGDFNEEKAGEYLLQALVNQTGLVQFAHILQGEDEIKVELDTLDVSTGSFAKDDYITKLANYEKSPDELYDKIKANINAVLVVNKQKNEEVIEYKLNKRNILRDQLNDLSSASHGHFDVEKMLDEFDQVLGKDKLDKEEYCKLWTKVWKQSMEGLKVVADSQDFEKSVPFAYVTNMVERCMNASLKLYGFEDKMLPRFGGMTIDDMSDFLTQGVSTWQQKHFEMFFDNMTQKQIDSLPNMEYRLKMWERIPIEDYKNLSFTKKADKFRDENGQLNQEGKLWATQTIINLFDRVNAMADVVTPKDIIGGNAQSVVALREKMHTFAEKLKKAAIEIGVVDEKSIEKFSGKGCPLAAEIEKFNVSINKSIEIESKLDEERRARYIREEQEQWDDFAKGDFDVFGSYDDDDVDQSFDLDEAIENEHQIARNIERSKEKREERKEIAATNEALSTAKKIDFKSFMDGRYDKVKKDPHSAYSLVAMSEMRELEVFFGAMQVDKYQKDYASLIPEEQLDIIEGEMSPSDEYACNYGVKISHEALTDIMHKMISQNLNSNLEVDKTVFSMQYALLFKDLYIETLHTLNKKCCADGTTFTSEQMNGSLSLLSKMMQDATKACGYPDIISLGGYTPKGIQKLQTDFVDKFVPKTTQEQALRKMQADSKEFDFTSENWHSGLGYTAFAKLIAQEKSLLGTKDARTAEGQAKIAQLYRAMVMYNAGRSRWSKFWNWRKNRAELASIQGFKESAMKNTGLDVRAFDSLLQNKPNESVNELSRGIEENYQLRLKGKDVDDVSNSSFKIKGDLESQSDLDDCLSERISVPEADHKTDVRFQSRSSNREDRRRDFDDSSLSNE